MGYIIDFELLKISKQLKDANKLIKNSIKNKNKKKQHWLKRALISIN